jgi:CDGSH-type Zn-finger protein/uncharacterized Fe-S cluster protein YjdI
MTEKRDRRYTGTDVDITYNLKRCIHAERCVHQLAQVFDKNARPWINPDGATAEEIAATIRDCPSGALHYWRKDGGAAEAVPEKNTVIVWRDGPLQFTGDLGDGETRATLCRCGASHNKPFCDNTHKEIGFSAQEVEPIAAGVEITGGPLTITPRPNGPLKIEGNLEIRDEAGNTLFTGNETALCRCGGSGRKPFCDGTHNRIGFKTEA